jgi:hypothetical protein
MRFPVPQFIDVEDKVIGQLTFKQAAYIAGGAGFVFIMFTFGGFFLAVVLGGPVALLAGALAFLKVHNRPFISIVYAFVFYLLSSRLYLWKKTDRIQHPQKNAPTANDLTQPASSPTLSQSRLKELAWSLDTKESMYESKEQWK